MGTRALRMFLLQQPTASCCWYLKQRLGDIKTDATLTHLGQLHTGGTPRWKLNILVITAPFHTSVPLRICVTLNPLLLSSSFSMFTMFFSSHCLLMGEKHYYCHLITYVGPSQRTLRASAGGGGTQNTDLCTQVLVWGRCEVQNFSKIIFIQKNESPITGKVRFGSVTEILELFVLEETCKGHPVKPSCNEQGCLQLDL